MGRPRKIIPEALAADQNPLLSSILKNATENLEKIQTCIEKLSESNDPNVEASKVLMTENLYEFVCIVECLEGLENLIENSFGSVNSNIEVNIIHLDEQFGKSFNEWRKNEYEVEKLSTQTQLNNLKMRVTGCGEAVHYAEKDLVDDIVEIDKI